MKMSPRARIQPISTKHGTEFVPPTLVPGGFGHRGTEGMIKAAEWARTNKTSYLGICLSVQIAVIESLGISATSCKRLASSFKGIALIQLSFMPEIDNTTLGGTMRLGIRPIIFQLGSEWSKLRQLYGEKKIINERHRHRYEVNPDYNERLAKCGLEFVERMIREFEWRFWS